MVVEVRKTLVWGIAVVSVASAMLLTSTGGGMPRIEGDMARARVAPAEPAHPQGAASTRSHAAPGLAGSAH
jgi:hypothetical protein